jgi:hypothetical protein
MLNFRRKKTIEEMKEETRQIYRKYSEEELEEEYQRDIDFFQMVASLFESFESYQKGVAKKERVESYDIHLDNLAKESNNKSFPDYQKQRANEDGFDSHADKLKYLAKKSGFDLTNNSVKQNNIETKVMDKPEIKSFRDFLQYTEERTK